jgi:dTMP kinase
MKKNLFISFEGIEGCGKSTQAKKLQEYFNQNKIENILTREPGGTEIGNKIREILLTSSSQNIQAITEVLLNFASRVEHCQQVIIPSLNQGKMVISDRFFDSTFAYQGFAQKIDIDQINLIKKIAIGNFVPDITFLIDLDVELAFERIKQRNDNNRYEKLAIEFHQQVRAGFLKLASQNLRIKIIDGNQSIEKIFLQIINYLQKNN